MKLRLECDVESRAMCPETTQIELENAALLTLYPDDQGILHRVAIEAATDDYHTETRSLEAQRTLKVTFRIDEQLKSQLIEELKFVEAALCMYGVHKLNWRDPKVVLVPENPKEEQELQVASFQKTHRYQDSPRVLKTHLLRECFRTLTVPLSFYREGENFYRDFRYVNAFRSFYYILEGFYAKGSYKHEEQTFKASQELVEATQLVLEQQMPEDHRERIRELLDRYGKGHTPEGLLELIVVFRHNIQHYFHLKKGQILAEDSLKEEFKTAALAAMLISMQVLWRKVDVLERESGDIGSH